MEVERLREEIEHEFNAAGENWSASVAYDALLLTPWLGFREDAQKIVIAITDVVPLTVYGTYRHPVDRSAATFSAAKLFLEAHPDITLYYSQDPVPHIDHDLYMNPKMNPRAGDGGSGFPALESKGLAHQIAWPFDQSEIPLVTQSVDDSRHLLVWGSSLPRPDEIGDATLEVAIRFTNPNSPGQTVETSYTEPIERERYDFALNMIGELGQPLDETYPEFLRGSGGNAVPTLGRSHLLSPFPLSSVSSVAANSGIGCGQRPRQVLFVPSGARGWPAIGSSTPSNPHSRPVSITCRRGR